MQGFLLLGGSNYIDGVGAGGGRRSTLSSAANRRSFSYGPCCCCWWPHHSIHSRRRSSPVVVASATINGDHYSVLGVSSDASSADIKKAYRLLALKYHPDVSKDSRADESFKSVRLAYDVLSNETTRSQYDQSLMSDEDTLNAWGGNGDYDPEFDDGIRVYRWAEFKRRMQHETYWRKHSSFDYEDDSVSEEEIPDEERGSFIEVLKSAILCLFLMQTIGARLSVTFSSLMAILDGKLDSGYKMGYVIAWILGGRGGVLLSLCLSFASWACGKRSSGVVSLVVVAMWVGSNMASCVPIPQGALVTLVYMSIKLQVDLA